VLLLFQLCRRMQEVNIRGEHLHKAIFSGWAVDEQCSATSCLNKLCARPCILAEYPRLRKWNRQQEHGKQVFRTEQARNRLVISHPHSPHHDGGSLGLHLLLGCMCCRCRIEMVAKPPLSGTRSGCTRRRPPVKPLGFKTLEVLPPGALVTACSVA
jgi:hypothetical protein